MPIQPKEEYRRPSAIFACSVPILTGRFAGVGFALGDWHDRSWMGSRVAVRQKDGLLALLVPPPDLRPKHKYKNSVIRQSLIISIERPDDHIRPYGIVGRVFRSSAIVEPVRRNEGIKTISFVNITVNNHLPPKRTALNGQE